MNARAMRTALALAAARPCLMCSRKAGGAVAFAPTVDSNVEFGLEPGQQQIVVFALCGHCWATTTPDQREDRLIERQGRAA